jgi:peptide/nickel transport system substrate-binding protein
MKVLVLFLLVMVLAITLAIASCGEEATTTPPTIQPTTQTTNQPTTETTTGPTTEPTTQPITTPSGRPAPKGTFCIAFSDFGWESMDPTYYGSNWGWAMYDPLIQFDQNGNFVPWVAESWEIGDDYFVFHIREGMKFHNGDPVTAHDVKFSVDRFGDMSLSTNPWSWYISEAYNKADSIIIDDYTYKFVSDHPEPTQMVVFAWTRILPKNAYEAVGLDYNEWAKHPIGSGPWKFIEHIPETSIKMEANTDYWNPDEIPLFKYLLNIQVPEQAIRIAMLKGGEVDLALGIDYDRVNSIVVEGFKTVAIGFPLLSNFAFQGTWLSNAGPTGDIRIRKAMSYALNRQEICDRWFAGYAKPGGNWFIHEGAFGWTDELGVMDPYDPDKAKALLAEAGYPSSFADPTVHFYTTPAGQDYVLTILDYWEDVGIDTQIEVIDSTINGAYIFNFNRLQEGDPNVGWVFTYLSGSTFNNMYHSSNMFCSWGTHNSGNDPVADELYLKAIGETDLELQRQYWAEFMLYAKSMYVNVGIASADTLILYNPNTIAKFGGRTWISLMDCANQVVPGPDVK